VRIKSTYFTHYLLLLTLITFCFNGSSKAQQSTSTNLGISWEPSSNPKEISSQLSFYDQIGIKFIELKHPISSSVLDSISRYPIQVLIRFDTKYLTTYTVNKNRDEIIQQYSSLILEYAEYESVIAYGLYSYSQSFDAGFIKSFETITDELQQISNREFYEITSGPFNALDFSIYEIKSGSLPIDISAFLLAKDNSPNDAFLLNELFQKNPELLFLDSNWLLKAIQIHPYLTTALQNFKNGEEFILPLQKKEFQPTKFNWPVLVFVIIWITMGIHVTVSQTYKPLIFRYFTGHRFFVDDVMRYRERSYVNGVFLFFQHAFFTGLVVYIFSALLISNAGLDVLYSSIPQFAIFGKNYFSLFILGTLFTVFIQLIALVWLYFPSISMTHFSQTLVLYTWVFHLDFLIVSAMLTLLLFGGSGNLILFLALLFVINWLVAFFLATLDSSKYLIQKRASYIFYTFGLYTIVNIGLLILFLSNDLITDFLELIFII